MPGCTWLKHLLSFIEFAFWRIGMTLPEIRLLQAAIVLAEELHFSRAADRLNISQSTLSKQILKLEHDIGFQLFRHNHQAGELTEAGRVFIAEARQVIAHAERSILSARAVINRPAEVLNIGKSSYTDPFLVSALLSIQLPLFPDLKVKLWSNFSPELAHLVASGSLDLALVTGIPQKQKLSVLHIADNPYYVVMENDDELAVYRELYLTQMHNRDWVIVGKHANVHVYDAVQSVASDKSVHPSDIYQFTSPEEASELVREHRGLAFLPRAAAWRISRDGLTLRPLQENRLRLVTSLAVHVDNKSRLVSEFVKAAGRKLGTIDKKSQGSLSLTA
jgi:DNA-binding transcriptional LysR family regulator